MVTLVFKYVFVPYRTISSAETTPPPPSSLEKGGGGGQITHGGTGEWDLQDFIYKRV